MAPQNSELINKRTLHAGTQTVPFKDGTKVYLFTNILQIIFNNSKFLDPFPLPNKALWCRK